MTDLSKAELKKRWGTMQKVVSAEPRATPDRQRHPARHGHQAAPDGRPRQRHARRLEHLPGLQVLRAVLPGGLQGQVRHRHQLRAAGRRHLQGRLRRGCHREASPVRHLPPDAGRPLQRAGRPGGQQGRAVREAGQGQVRQRARPDAPADRGRQAADRLRRAERHLPLHRQEDAGPRPVPGHLPRQPPRR